MTRSARTLAPRTSATARCRAACLTALLHLPCLAAAQTLVTSNPNQVEAAFLRNFARYVTWPAQAFANDSAPWHICVLGSERFVDEALEKTLRGRVEQGRGFEIFRAATTDQLPNCHIVFVGYDNATSRRAAIQAFKGRPVLTVGDAPEFLDEGGVIRFQVGQHVEMSINLDQARATSLLVPTKMLEVSREVVENGALRRLR